MSQQDDPRTTRDLDVELVRIEQDVARYEAADRPWLRRVYHAPLGAMLGFLGGASLVVLYAVFLKFMNPFSALGIVLATTIGGTLAAHRRGPPRATPEAIALRTAYRELRSDVPRDPTRAHDRFVDNVHRLEEPRSHPPQKLPALPAAGDIKLSELLLAALRDTNRNSRLIPVIGCGLSLRPDVPGNFPGWNELPRRLLAECDTWVVWNNEPDRTTLRARLLDQGAMPRDSLLRELDTLKHKLGAHYQNALTTIFRPKNGSPGAAHHAVVNLRTRVVLTTACDQLMEAATVSPRQPYTWRKADLALADIKDDRRVLLKLHGTAEDEDSVVLTAEEYDRAYEDPGHRIVMHYLLLGHSLLFIGFGEAHPGDLDLFLEKHSETLKKGQSAHYALMSPLPDPYQNTERQDRLRRLGVTVISIEPANLVPYLETLAVVPADAS